MKKNAVIDYDKLYEDLLKINTLPIYKKIENIEDEITLRSTNVPMHKFYTIRADIKNLRSSISILFHGFL